MPDSCYTRSSIFAIQDSTDALRRIADGEQHGRIAPADGRLMRAQVRVNFHAGLTQDNTILQSCTEDIQRGLRDDSVWLVAQRRLMYLDFLTAYMDGQEKLEYCLQAIKTAHETGSEADEQYFTFVRLCFEYQLHPTIEHGETLRREGMACIRKIEKQDPRYRRLSNAYFTYFRLMLNMGHYEETIHAGNTLLNKYQHDSTLKHLAYPSLATAYAATGQQAAADSCYRLWRQTAFGQAPEHQILCLGYLCRSGIDNSKKAIEIAKTYEHQFLTMLDLPNQIGFYHDLAMAYQQIGDYQSAYQTIVKQSEAHDRMLHKNIEDEGQKWAKRLELQEKNNELERQQARNQMVWMIAGCMLLVILILTVACWFGFRASREMKRKNKTLVRQLDRIERYRTEVSKLRISALHRRDAMDAADAISDEELYALLEQKTNELELFTKPKYPFLDMCITLGVSQSRLQTFFKNSPDFSHLEDYLDMKRVVRSCDLLRQQPKLSMKEVCLQSGFTNTRQFNRKFKEAMDMTPSEYKHLKIGLNT